MFRKKPQPPVRRRVDLSQPPRRHIEPENAAQTFVRSRTIANVAELGREEIQTQRQRAQKLRARRRRLGTVLLILLILIIAALALLSQFAARVDQVVFTQPPTTQPNIASYEKLARDYFQTRPFERFSFAFHKDDFSNYISSKAPEVQSTSLSLNGFLSGKLTLTLRQPVAMWQSNSSVQFVDSGGTIFTKNYFASPDVSIVDDSGAQTVDSGAVTSSRFLKFVGQVVAGVAKSGVGTVQRVVIPAGAIRYVDFYISGRNYPFKAQIDRDASGQTSDIVNMIKYLSAHNLTPSSYVDVRVAGKGYWK